MSDLLQPGQQHQAPRDPIRPDPVHLDPVHLDPVHLDPDQLSAFIEDALPLHERQQTLAHLASCPYCRNLVHLATPQPELTPEPTPQPIRKRLTWFPIFTFALPALAAIILLTLYLRKPTTSTVPPTEQAQITSTPALPTPTPAPATASTPAPLPIPKTPSLLTPKPAAPPAKPAIVLGAITSQQAPASQISQQQITSLPLQGRNQTQLSQQSTAPAQNYLSDSQQQSLPAPQSLHGQAMGVEAIPRPLAAPRAAGVTLGATALPQPAPAPAPALPTTVTAGAAAARTGSAVPSAAASNAALGTSTFSADALSDDASAVASLTPARPLPSHLPILSTVSTPNQTLALDTHHTLFLTRDAGLHWTPISTPWKTQAITITLTSNPPAPAAASAQPQPKVPAQPPIPVASTTLTGTITDQTGAIIPNATVTLTNQQSTHTARTDRNGTYTLTNLPPGTYQLQAQSPGFELQTLSALTLTPQTQTTTNLTLQVGAAAETVEVTTNSVVPTVTLRALKKSKSPQPLFQITTDTNEHWTSPDGTHWTKSK